MRVPVILALAIQLCASSVACSQQQSACGNTVPNKPNKNHPTVRVVSVHFEDITEIPRPVLLGLATRMKIETKGEDWFVESCERMKDAYQQRGYFKAEPRLSFSQVGGDSEHPRMALTISAGRPGIRYRLGTIAFKNHHVLSESRLRARFLIRNGETFNTDLIRKGLEELRRAYDRLGYVDFTSVPDTVVNDQARSVGLLIDVDEGKLFRLKRVAFAGVMPGMQAEMRQWWAPKIGWPFDGRDVERFYQVFRKRVPYKTLSAESGTDMRRNETDATIDLWFNFGPDPEVYADNPVITPSAGRRR